MNKNQLNSAWKTSSHDERNQFINDYSIGAIDISDTACIEIFKVGNEVVAMDHEDINEPHPFFTPSNELLEKL